MKIPITVAFLIYIYIIFGAIIAQWMLPERHEFAERSISSKIWVIIIWPLFVLDACWEYRPSQW
jgi:hypothetical protein